MPGVPKNCVVEAEAGTPYRMKFTYEKEGDLIVFMSLVEKFPERSKCMIRKLHPTWLDIDLTNQTKGVYYFTLESDSGVNLSIKIMKGKAQILNRRIQNSLGSKTNGEGEYFELARKEANRIQEEKMAKFKQIEGRNEVTADYWDRIRSAKYE